MKTVLSKIKYIALSLMVVLAFSCSAEDGAPGEQGPQGVQGPQGAQGEKGDKGDPGESGSGGAISVLLENQTLTLGEMVFDVPQLTQDIFDNGLVYGYVTVDPAIWLSMPVTQLQNIGTEEEPVLASIVIIEIIGMEVGKVYINSLIEGAVDLRFVLINGTAAEANAYEINDFL
ncbi:collagen-like triple helix repeat-containing protein [Algibacter mikhailovii]|uniref:collagen-like triple helix repeat-containing protein n=1 Tax=Algibacter mikhailovii TaxID=425498 RepID=UPI002494BCC9|nr:collagen-like protein [Algibacter mikhailovii]